MIKNNFAKKSLRTILTAYKDISTEEFEKLLAETKNLDISAKIEKFAEGMTMIALYGLKDPLKRGVIEAIHACQRAGVTVRMVTGDNLDTATAIAKDAGILPSDFDPEHPEPHQKYACMTGKQFREMIKLR